MRTIACRAAAATLALISAATVPAAALPPAPAPAALPAPHVISLADDLRTELAELHRDRPRASRSTARATVSTHPIGAATPTTPARRPRSRATAHPTFRVAAAGDVAAVLAYALAQVGDPYRMGAAGPGAWDCSGLVMAAWARVGVRLPHNAAAMLSYGHPVSRSQLAPGDLVFPDAGHVQLYLGSGLVVEAANPRAGVRVIALWGFWTARRL